ncbi:hypothetical protein PPERSA_05851 [Pseudocohnilembus persalinus]|uniref:Uncharacterized protein n=1 Tax=Pseudocohnilembus persalinus TaxID=266149 RepID=A0A0V0R3Z0_PSEPJ|nr:hypothetical protein PPERSA_05851 [Pseudocohnilembus persalinus]|eukprot:KRX09182.1 hypothetical protein PPERSA_05851 [Pseudocohnilembus persalinus]
MSQVQQQPQDGYLQPEQLNYIQQMDQQQEEFQNNQDPQQGYQYQQNNINSQNYEYQNNQQGQEGKRFMGEDENDFLQDQQQQYYQNEQFQQNPQEIEALNYDLNQQNLSPSSQKEYIQFLQDKLREYEVQLSGKQNSFGQDQQTPIAIYKNGQNNENGYQENTEKQQVSQPPQYPKGYEDWIIRQSISPKKNEYFSENNYYQDYKQYTFKPNINQKSLKMSQRLEKQPESYMVKYLYGDALSRFSKIQNKQREIEQNINQQSNRSKIGMKSQKIVLKKIEESLSNILNTIEESEELSFENLGYFFEQLGLFKALKFKKTNQNETSLYLHDRQKVDIQRLSREMQFHEQIWKVLINNNPEAKIVNKRLIFEFTMILLEKRLFISQSITLMEHILKESFEGNINIPLTIKQAEENQLNSQQFQNQEGEQQQQEGAQSQDEQNILWSLEQLISEFRKLFEDKTSLMEYYGSQKPILDSVNEQNDENRTFQPKINKKSAIIDKNNNGERKRYDLLYDHSKYLLEKQKEQKERQEMQILEQCTFQPQTNDFNFREYSDAAQSRFEKLYNLQDQWLMKKSQNKAFLDQQRMNSELKECTFKPKLVSNVPIKQANTDGQLDQKSFLTEVKGSEQVIQRYQKAREEKQQIASYWEKKEENWKNHDVTKTTETQPFSFALQSQTQKSFRREKGEILGSVDVNYAKGKKSKIVIYKGDNPRKLASGFAKIHNLGEEMTECLVEMLEQYIQNVETQPEQQEQQSQ